MAYAQTRTDDEHWRIFGFRPITDFDRIEATALPEKARDRNEATGHPSTLYRFVMIPPIASESITFLGLPPEPVVYSDDF